MQNFIFLSDQYADEISIYCRDEFLDFEKNLHLLFRRLIQVLLSFQIGLVIFW